MESDDPPESKEGRFTKEDFDEINFDYQSLFGELPLAGLETLPSLQDEGEEQVKSFEQIDFSSFFNRREKAEGTYFNITEVKTPRIPPGEKSYRELPDYKGPSVGCLKEDGIHIVFESEGKKLVVGHARRQTRCTLEIDVTDAFTLADKFSEEIGGKGTGLGFSSFMHSAACVCLAKAGGLLEPVEGNDVTFLSKDVSSKSVVGFETGLSIEVTGLNYLDRSTRCNWVINKYAFLSGAQQYERFSRLSRAEETFDSLMFKDTGMNLKDSIYTKNLERLHLVIRKLTKKQMEGLGVYLTKWFEEVVVEEPEQLKDPTWPEDFRRLILEKGSKGEGSNAQNYPVPFRALPRRKGPPLQEAIWYDRRVDVRWDSAGGKSSYHCLTMEDDIFELTTGIMAGASTYDYPEHDCIESLLFHNMLMKYESIQAACLEADLFQRIDGKKGSFYSRNSCVGLTWEAKNRNSTVYNCRFYTFKDPGDPKKVGRWSCIDSVWYGPTFKLNRSEISHSITVPGKLAACWVSLCNTAGKYEYTFLAEKMALISNIWRNSSWQTSTYTSTSRFKTTGHMGSAGNFNAMCRKAWSNVRPLRSSDYLLFMLDYHAAISPRSESVTPLLGLPMRYHCLEKDIAHGMHWHIRKANHERDCVKKLLNGLQEEIKQKDELNNWYGIQADYLEGVIKSGTNYNRYCQLMSMKPGFPCFNVIMYVGLCWHSKESLSAASSTQTNTGWSIHGMASDKGTIGNKRSVLVSTKVANALNKLVLELKPSGPYDFLLKTLSKDTKEHLHYIFAKDAKSADREIMIMHFILRAMQYYAECMHQTVSNASPDDALLDVDKYGPMVTNFMRIMKNDNVVLSSEDRSFFCGRLHPEAMSLHSLCISKVTGSNPMVSAAAIQFLKKEKTVVLPKEVGIDDIPKGVPYEAKTVFQGNKHFKCLVVKMNKHMGQGLDAISGGVLNTVTNRGMMNICKILLRKQIRDEYIITTSDDVGRGVALENRVDKKRATDLIIRKPLQLLPHLMMLNNSKKLVVTDKRGMIEVNNLTTITSGMLPQSHIFAVLAMQPLNGPGPFHDLQTVVAQSRAVLWWSAPPNVAWAAFVFNLKALHQRWRFRQEEMQMLEDSGLLPNNISELISGFWPRKPQALSALWSCNSPANKTKVLSGDRPLQLSFSNLTAFRHEDPTVDTFPLTGFRNLDRKFESIMMGRKIGGRVKPSHLRQPKVSRLIQKKDRMMELLNAPVVEVPDLSVFAPPHVTISLQPVRRKDRTPCVLGYAKKTRRPNLKKVRAYKEFGILHRELLNEDELKLVGMNEEDFRKYELKDSMAKKYEGMAFKSPAGLPSVGFLDGQVFKYPQSFNFTPQVVGSAIPERQFVYRGNEVEEFKVMHWGGMTIKSNPLAFGWGRIGDDWYVFFQLKGRTIDCRRVDFSQKIGTFPVGTTEVSYILGRDYNPISGGNTSHVPLSLGNVRGEPLSLANYGNWCKTNSKSAFKFYRSVFDENGSTLPFWCIRYMDVFPHYQREPIEMGQSREYLLIGRHTNTIKLVPGLMGLAIVDASEKVAKLKLSKVDQIEDGECLVFD